jgi:hypothetical protein
MLSHPTCIEVQRTVYVVLDSLLDRCAVQVDLSLRDWMFQGGNTPPLFKITELFLQFNLPADGIISSVAARLNAINHLLVQALRGVQPDYPNHVHQR